jgi:hypothetical protein
MFVKSEKGNFSGARLSASRPLASACLHRCALVTRCPLASSAAATRCLCLLALTLPHASVAALCCLALLLAEQLHAAAAATRLAAAATQAAPSRRGCCCHRTQAAAAGAARSRRRRCGPKLPHGAATECRSHRAVTAETWFPTSVGSDAVAST